MNLADILASHARNRPTEPAIISGGATVGYGALAALVATGAARLAGRGVGPGTVVGLCLPDTAAHLALHFAVARAGGVILPLDHRWTATEQAEAARAFGARVVVNTTGEAVAPGIAGAAADAVLAPGAGGLRASGGEATAPLLISLSSGTTGRPKGAIVSHGQMYERFVNQWVSLGINVGDRFAAVTPLYFGAGRSFAMSALVAGATVVLAPPPHRQPGELAAAINASGATVCFVVPTQLRKLLAEAPMPDGLLLPGLRLLITGGAIIGADEARAIRARVSPRLASYYATSEGGGISVLYPEEFDAHGDSVGRPVFRVAVEVVDADDRPLPAGVVGRVRFRGPGVATTFLADDGSPQAPAGDGAFYPGDLAIIDATGYVTLQGRERDLVIRGGVNVYPAEVERVLGGHPAVREAAVVGWPSPALGEEVAAFVVADPGTDGAALRDWCRERLAPYKVPRAVFVVAELPKTGAGKVSKAELAAALPPLPAD